jgi:predicted ATP-grasp superfamily ATP-dependent carboligase
MRILLTDAKNRSTLAAVRSLYKAGHILYVICSSKSAISAKSKYTFKSHYTVSPIEDPHGYIWKIKKIILKERIDILIPMSDASIAAVNYHRKEIDDIALVGCIKPEAAEGLLNKYRLFKLAKRLRIPIPKTFFIKDRSDFEQIVKEIYEFPIIVKPAYSKQIKKDRIISGKVKLIWSIKDLQSYLYNLTCPYPLLLQKVVNGPGIGLFTLFDHNEHKVLFSHERILEKPPSGGVSVVSVSRLVEAGLADNAQKLLSAVNFKGVAMVEFKKDIVNGGYKLMEVNGRLWGSLELAIWCGIDFPTLFVNMITNNEVNAKKNQLDYQKDMQLIWLLGTLDHLLIRMKKGDPIFNNFHPKIQAIRSMVPFSSAKNHYDVLRLDDLRPFLYEVKDYIIQTFK